MQGTLYSLLQDLEQAYLHQETDTATPRTPVPIYFIHSFEQPFCAVAECSCHLHEQEARQLFVKIIEGHVELEPVTMFSHDVCVERK